MFGGGATNPYDDIVIKATDENLTSENWEIILNLCDKVQDEGEEGARNVIAALLKRLAHRNPNVQLYALSLAESLTKNLGIELHREIASRAFTQGLEKIITDRTTHEKVRKRALGLIAMWTNEFESDTTLGIMEECYNNLKAKNYKFEQPSEPPPPAVDDEIRRKEEEELQRVLEMSMQDKGGRNQWSNYSAASSSGAGGSGSSSSVNRNNNGPATTSSASTSKSTPAAAPAASAAAFTQPKYNAGYVPARTPTPEAVPQQKQQQHHHQPHQTHHHHHSQAQQQSSQPSPQQRSAASSSTISVASTASAATSPTVVASPTAATMPTSGNIVTRVRALHAFEPTEPGELAFEKGDIIKVVDRGYKDWWRGQLKGRTGIFPVNYVEAMPEPTAVELAKEAEQEAAVFSQAVNVEKLLNMLRALDPVKDNLADNEEIQELYRSSMALRPKIVKLIDKYSQKRADLVSMNETFVRARSIFDRMMEESLARHTGVYDQPTYRPAQYAQPQGGIRPDSRSGPAAGRGAGPQAYGWNPNLYEQPGYNAYPAPAGAYPQQQQQAPQAHQQPHPQQQQQPEYNGGSPPPAAYVYGVVPQGGYAGQQPGLPYGQQGPTPYPQQQVPQGQGQPQQQQPQQVLQGQPAQQPQLQPIQQQPIQPQQQPIQQQPIQPQQQPIQQQQQPLQAQQQQPIQQQPIQQQPIQPQQQPIQPVQQQPVQQQPIQAIQRAQSLQAQPVQQQVQPIQQQPIQQQPVQQQPVQQQPVQQQPIQQQPLQQQPIQEQEQPIQQAQPIQQQVQPVQQAQLLQQQTQPIQQAQPLQQAQPIEQAQPIQQQAQPAQQAQPIQQQQAQATQQTQQGYQLHDGPIQQQQTAAAASADSGPPYVFDPNTTYSDPNVQAWAQYYAMGGTDLAGSVYFISVPGVTEPAPVPSSPQRATGLAAQSQQQTAGAQVASNENLHASYQQQQQPANDAGYAGQRLHDHGHPQPERQSSPQAGAGGTSPRTSLGDGARRASGGYSSPVQASSTPAWVLPKKTAEPRLGSSPTNSGMAYGGAGPSGSYFPSNGQVGAELR